MKKQAKKFLFITFLIGFMTQIMILFPFAAQSASKKVLDQTGRTITVPVAPERIVALAPSITEIIFALGKKDLLKGVTVFSDYPLEAAKKFKVGTYIRLDLERIVSLSPDLCIAIKDGNPLETVQRLEKLNIPVYAVNPRSLESVMDAILGIGKLVNAQPVAEKIVRKMKHRIDLIKKQVEKIENRPKVFFQIGVSPIVAAGDATFIHELITVAGGNNLSKGPTPYPRFNREQVLALSPDILLITSMARNEVFEQVKAEWERWPKIPAVKNGRIHILDSNVLDRPGPRMVEGLELLFSVIHPKTADQGRH
ncbi:cobalamin-binding protein [Desulfobacterales bacterium HSG16]|nr:cobalamin-binding protein [Desulfobacterales bacterium HSG16]